MLQMSYKINANICWFFLLVLFPDSFIYTSFDSAGKLPTKTSNVVDFFAAILTCMYDWFTVFRANYF